jgi:hypothetical protein
VAGWRARKEKGQPAGWGKKGGGASGVGQQGDFGPEV